MSGCVIFRMEVQSQVWCSCSGSDDLLTTVCFPEERAVPEALPFLHKLIFVRAKVGGTMLPPKSFALT